MDERSERGHVDSEAFEHGVIPANTSGPHAPAYDPETDPVLKALRAAPWAQISEEERAELDELERNAGPTIPGAEFMRDLEAWIERERERENVGA